MDVRIFSWTVPVIVGVLIIGTGVHYFRCSTEYTTVKYADHSLLLYYCPVPTNDHDIILSVAVANGQLLDERTWGQPSNSTGEPPVKSLSK